MIKNLAPEIFRQRLLIEGYYNIEVDAQTIEHYFQSITKTLNLRMYSQPIIFQPAGLGKEDNAGYDAFVPLIDSGISLYVWSKAKFMSVVIYTCKGFDATVALEETKTFFKLSETESASF